MQRVFNSGAGFLCLTALILSSIPLSSVSAGTCYTITGIGTSLTDDFPIDTHVDRVMCDDPVATDFHGMPVCEMRGTVSGIGWGGGGIVPRAVNAHYRYEIPFLARWRRDCPAPRLVFYNHGGGASVMMALKRDKLVGAANPNRTAENNGDQLVGVGALLDQACYISINRRGLRKNGAFSATYLPPVGPLTAAEVATLEADLAGAPGDPNYRHPGIAAGAAVPLVPTNDAPTFRDVARALELVIARYAGGPFRTRIAVGTSSGSRLFSALNFGRSVIGMAGARTGGNHVVPYDAGSARIFDGFILSGFTYAPNVQQADSALPLSAPVMFYQGQGDERYQQHVTMAHELMQRGVTLDGRVWLYEIKNQTHITRDIVAETTQPSDGDRSTLR